MLKYSGLLNVLKIVKIVSFGSGFGVSFDFCFAFVCFVCNV